MVACGVGEGEGMSKMGDGARERPASTYGMKASRDERRGRGSTVSGVVTVLCGDRAAFINKFIKGKLNEKERRNIGDIFHIINY